MIRVATKVNVRRLHALQAGLRKQMHDLIAAACDMAIEDMHNAMREPKTGRFYMQFNPRTGKMFVHQASAPGEAPAILTGRLYKSLKPQRAGYLHQTIQTVVPYASELEFGGVNLEPRPFFLPAFTKASHWYVEMAKTAISDVERRTP